MASTTMNNIKGRLYTLNKGLFKFSDIVFDTPRVAGF
jgi:hypothetical protein